jgi:hypothetical protein
VRSCIRNWNNFWSFKIEAEDQANPEEIETIPLRRNSLEAQLAASASAVDVLKHKTRQTEVDRKKLELDVGTRTESIARFKTQQYQTRKNDEFQALGHEIERFENEIRKIEDEELELMVQADKIKIDLAEEEKKAAGVRESITRQTADLDEKSKALESLGRLDLNAQGLKKIDGASLVVRTSF